MSVVIFVIGVLVFFLTVYGVVVAGGLELTRQQIAADPGLAPDLPVESTKPGQGIPAKNVLKSDY